MYANFYFTDWTHKTSFSVPKHLLLFLKKIIPVNIFVYDFVPLLFCWQPILHDFARNLDVFTKKLENAPRTIWPFCAIHILVYSYDTNSIILLHWTNVIRNSLSKTSVQEPFDVLHWFLPHCCFKKVCFYSTFISNVNNNARENTFVFFVFS